MAKPKRVHAILSFNTQGLMAGTVGSWCGRNWQQEDATNNFAEVTCLNCLDQLAKKGW